MPRTINGVPVADDSAEAYMSDLRCTKHPDHELKWEYYHDDKGKCWWEGFCEKCEESKWMIVPNGYKAVQM